MPRAPTRHREVGHSAKSLLLQASGLIGAALGRAGAISIEGEPRQTGSSPRLHARIHIQRAKSTPLVLLPAGYETGRERNPVFVTSRVAPRLQQQWRDAGQSYVDLAGHVFLAMPGLLVDKTVKRQRGPGTRPRNNPFGDRGSLVTRRLLETGGERIWQVRELAIASGVSLGTTSGVVARLSAMGFLRTEKTGRQMRIELTDPASLFSHWTTVYDWRMNQSVIVSAPISEPRLFIPRLVRALAQTKTQWALTLQAGASLITHHAIWNTIHAYLDLPSTADIQLLAAQLGWTPDPGGRLVLMRPYYKTAIWTDIQTVRDVPIVGDLQLALDLWHYPERGLEPAEDILRSRLGIRIDE